MWRNGYWPNLVFRFSLTVMEVNVYLNLQQSISIFGGAQIIMQHHKLTNFKRLGHAENALINAVRKADWADATMGLIRFGLPAALLEAAYDEIKEDGFHSILMGMDSILSPGNKLNGTIQVLKIFKW